MSKDIVDEKAWDTYQDWLRTEEEGKAKRASRLTATEELARRASSLKAFPPVPIRAEGEPYDPNDHQHPGEVFTKFTKHDKGKHDWTKFPWRAADAIMTVMEHGAEKYGWDNWRGAKGEDVNRYMAAALRHCIAEINGHPIDHDSQLLAVEHALCSLMFYVECRRVERERAAEEEPPIFPGMITDAWEDQLLPRATDTPFADAKLIDSPRCPDNVDRCNGPEAAQQCGACFRSRPKPYQGGRHVPEL